MPDLFSQPIVSNTGPLLGLSRIGRLDILGQLFPRVIVPREVMDELLVAPFADTDGVRVALKSFMVADSPVRLDPLLATQLDPGEAAVITTATMGSFPVLMDERKGRRVASLVYNLSVIGTGGLLVAAKHRGLIAAVGPLLEGMRAGGYHLGPTLIAECRRRAGE